MNALSMIRRCAEAQSDVRFLDDARAVHAVAVALRRIVEEGGDHNFLILHADDRKNYYVQFAGSRGQAIVRGEAVSNHYLEPAHMLSPKRCKALLALGWNAPAPGEDLNFYRDWDARSKQTRREMARLAARTLVEIYGLAPTERVGFEFHLDRTLPAKVLARPSARVDH
jgi:hypothetical protein